MKDYEADRIGIDAPGPGYEPEKDSLPPGWRIIKVKKSKSRRLRDRKRKEKAKEEYQQKIREITSLIEDGVDAGSVVDFDISFSGDTMYAYVIVKNPAAVLGSSKAAQKDVTSGAGETGGGVPGTGETDGGVSGAGEAGGGVSSAGETGGGISGAGEAGGENAATGEGVDKQARKGTLAPFICRQLERIKLVSETYPELAAEWVQDVLGFQTDISDEIQGYKDVALTSAGDWKEKKDELERVNSIRSNNSKNSSVTAKNSRNSQDYLHKNQEQTEDGGDGQDKDQKQDEGAGDNQDKGSGEVKKERAANTYNDRQAGQNDGDKRNPGGQPGHAGTTFTFKTEEEASEWAKRYGAECIIEDIGNEDAPYVSRYEIGRKVIPTLTITHYHADEDGKFRIPPGVPMVGYGPSVISKVVYDHMVNDVAVGKIAESIRVETNGAINLSTGTIDRMLDRFRKASAQSLEYIDQKTEGSPILNTDATYVQKNGKTVYIRNMSSKDFVRYYAMDKKSQEELDKKIPFLKEYGGVLIHDHYHDLEIILKNALYFSLYFRVEISYRDNFFSKAEPVGLNLGLVA